MSEFSSSADILSSPSASTLLIYLISQVISPIVDQVTAMATSVCSASVSNWFSWYCLFKSWLGYSTHLLLSSRISVTILLSLLLNDRSDMLHFLASFSVVFCASKYLSSYLYKDPDQ